MEATACRLGFIRTPRGCKHREHSTRKIRDKTKGDQKQHTLFWGKGVLGDLEKFRHVMDEGAYAVLQEEAGNRRESLEKPEKHPHRRFFREHEKPKS